PALITGAFADRIGFRTYLLFLVLWSLLVYVPFVHWIWGHGWLAQMGVVDFAGGLVVHLSAGMAALASVFVVGSRKPGPEGSRLPHNLPFVALGTGLLWFGWFGFNGGSALAANGVAAIAFVNTNTAASAAMVTWMLIGWWHTGKPSMSGAMAGAVAGLATITPAAGFVPTWSALIIGFAAGAVCYGACQFRAAREWDDALDVWAVHGVGGALGVVLTGVFATVAINGVKGVIDGGARELGVQIVGVAVVGAYSFIATVVILRLIGLFMDVRVPAEDELGHLDGVLHGETAYQPFWSQMDGHSQAAPVAAEGNEIRS
ncbi:MAG TPA: ammonium transporter, partial [Chloroflexota bacterium]|nr:ammonium transporter [Chloroflexota bacterium]